MSDFNAKKYWEERLAQNFNLHGVGYKSLGEKYNNWMYRVRQKIFHRKIPAYVTDFRNVKVLDVGSGTGFYIERWRELGVVELAGSDLTAVAVEKLKEKFPQCNFYQLDIGDKLDIPDPAGFDVVSAFDVLFHIVDDEKFNRALQNIFSLLNPGGLFIWSDNFIHHDAIKIAHQVSRPLTRIEAQLQETGFEVLERTPMFCVMNSPVDSGSFLAKKGWEYFSLMLSLGEWVGWIAGAMLYPLELFLTSVRKESPSTEMMICRKREKKKD